MSDNSSENEIVWEERKVETHKHKKKKKSSGKEKKKKHKKKSSHKDKHKHSTNSKAIVTPDKEVYHIKSQESNHFSNQEINTNKKEIINRSLVFNKINSLVTVEDNNSEEAIEENFESKSISEPKLLLDNSIEENNVSNNTISDKNGLLKSHINNEQTNKEPSKYRKRRQSKESTRSSSQDLNEVHSKANDKKSKTRIDDKSKKEQSRSKSNEVHEKNKREDSFCKYKTKKNYGERTPTRNRKEKSPNRSNRSRSKNKDSHYRSRNDNSYNRKIIDSRSRNNKEGSVNRSKRDRSESRSRIKKEGSVNRRKRDRSESRSKKEGSINKKKRERSESRSKKEGSINKKKRERSESKSKKESSITRKKKERSESKSKKEDSITRKKKERSESRSKKEGSITRKKRGRSESGSRKESSVNRTKRERSESRNRRDRKRRSYSRSNNRVIRARSGSRRRNRSRSRNRGRGSSHSRNRRDRSNSRSKHNRNSRSRSHSPRNRRRRSRQRSEEIIDKNRLLQVALSKVKSNILVTPIQDSVKSSNQDMIAMKSGGRSVFELTEYCRKLAEDQKEPLAGSDSEDAEEGIDNNRLSHPFTITPSNFILPTINTSMISTPEPLMQEKLRLQYPVSSGTLHRQKELGETKTSCDALVPLNVEKESSPDLPVVDLASSISLRAKAAERLKVDPNDMEAQNQLSLTEKAIQNWAKPKIQEGAFGDNLELQVLTPEELEGPTPAWVKKDQFSSAAPVLGGKGSQIMQMMGWSPGEGLGRNRGGALLPILPDIKTDKKGLYSDLEQVKGKNATSNISKKHPVSILVELCNRKKWESPDFVLISEHGPPHNKKFVYKVIVHGKEYQNSLSSNNKKLAKAQASVACLKALGELPEDCNPDVLVTFLPSQEKLELSLMYG